MSFSDAEIMAIVLSRELADGDVVITGTNAAIPTAAYRVAQRLRAPRIVAINGGLGTVDPVVGEVPPSSADERYRRGRFNISLADTVRAEMRGLIDVICLGALQVDSLGRCNLAVVGDYERPTLRGPGTLGLSFMATVPRVLMYVTRHEPRTFVEAVDFVSAESLQPDGRGLGVIVTPLGVLAPDARRERLRLRSIHPGVDLDELVGRTGFDLGIEGPVPLTPLPDAAEAEALATVDAGGSLRGPPA